MHLDITVIADNAMVIVTLQCDYYHYAICYIGSAAVVVPLCKNTVSLWQFYRITLSTRP